MADNRRDIDEALRGALRKYRENLMFGISLYDKFLDSAPPVNEIRDIKEDKKKIEVLRKDLDYLSGVQDAIEDFISNVCDQIRKVNGSFIKVRDTLRENTLDPLIKDGEQILSYLGSLRSSANVRMDIAKALLKSTIPGLYGVSVVYDEIKKAFRGKQSVSTTESAKSRPESSSGGVSSPKPIITTPTIEPVPKDISEAPAASSVSTTESAKSRPESSSGGVSSPKPIITTPTITEKSASPTDVSKALDKDKNEPFTRQGQLYKPERNALGQFTGGKVVQENAEASEDTESKNRTIEEESEKESVQEGLTRFFSKSAYEAKWTAELLDAVKEKPSAGDNEKGKSVPGKSIMDNVKGLVDSAKMLPMIGATIGILGAGLVGASVGTAINKMGVGDAIQGIGAKFHNEKTELKDRAQSSSNPVLQRSMELQANGVSSKEAMDEAMKEKGTPVEQARWTHKEAIADKKTLASVSGAETKPPLPKVPVDTTQDNIQKGMKDDLDKIYVVMTDIKNTLNDAGKTTSTKNPSGYNANNTRNPVLSSLGAGLLDIS